MATVQDIPKFDSLYAGMVSYVNGIQFDGDLPTDLVDPDPFPPGDEEFVYKEETVTSLKKTVVQV